MGLEMGGGGVDVHGLGVSEELLEVGGRVESILHAPAVAGLSDLLSLTDGLNWTELECQVKCWINCLLPLLQRQQRYCQDPHCVLQLQPPLQSQELPCLDSHCWSEKESNF